MACRFKTPLRRYVVVIAGLQQLVHGIFAVLHHFKNGFLRILWDWSRNDVIGPFHFGRCVICDEIAAQIVCQFLAQRGESGGFIDGSVVVSIKIFLATRAGVAKAFLDQVTDAIAKPFCSGIPRAKLC